MPTINFDIFGGMNQSDQPQALINRAFQEGQNGFSQYAPVESPNLQDMDFDQFGIKSRKGSIENEDISSVLITGEVLIKGIEWDAPADGAKTEIIVGRKSIYIRDAGVWAQANDSASAAYTHAADVTKVGFTTTDGHLFIGLDGANQIQVFKSGADLDPEMKNGNLYEEAFSATTNTITGTWPTGTYLVTVVHNRLVHSDGNTLLEFTPQAHTASSGIWKFGDGGFFQASGNIKAMWSFVPQFTNSIDEFLYIGSSAGIEVLTGFATTDKLVRIEGSKPSLNHQTFAKAKNWVVYLGEDKNIYGINGTKVINLGRRIKKPTLDGVLDKMNIATSLTNSFAFYNTKKEQIQIYISTSSARINDTCIMIDFKLGEPIISENQTQFEQRVRLVPWKIKDPDDNDWYVGVYQQQDNIIGILNNGKLLNQETKDVDLSIKQNIEGITLTSGSDVSILISSHGYIDGALVKFDSLGGTTELNGNFFFITVTDASNFTLDDTDGDDFTAYTSGGTSESGKQIDAFYFTPHFSAGSARGRLKQWSNLIMRTISLGDWNTQLDTYLDFADASTETNQFSQLRRGDAAFDVSRFDLSNFAPGSNVKQKDRVDRRSEVVQHRLSAQGPNRPFIIESLVQDYTIGAQVN